jgi:oligopeptide transport system permease protein
MASKIVNAILSLLLIAAITHFLSLHLPGDPFSTEKPLRLEAKQALRAYYGLDDPFYVQFCTYLSNLSKGILGYSLIYKGLTVNSLIAKSFPVSALLGTCALFLAIAFGIFWGTLSALYHQKWQDQALFCLTCLILSTPSFILATIFQYFFAIKMHLFPIAKWEGFSSITLPAISLACVPAAFIAKQMRENLLKLLQADFILLAKVKGLKSVRIVFFHLLPNALIPLFGYFGQLAANILTGSFLIERIFAIPGLGFWFVSSILERDYPVIFGLTIFYSFLLIFFSLMMDLLVQTLDIRTRENRYA